MRRFLLAATPVLLACSSDPAPGGAVAQGAGGGGGSASTAAGGTGATAPDLQLGDPLVTIDATKAEGVGAHFLRSRVHAGDLYVCTGRSGLVTIDVAADGSLAPLDQLPFTISDRCEYLTIDEEHALAFVTHAQEQINPQSFIGVVDIAQPSSLVQKSILPRDVPPAGLDYEAGVLVLATKTAGVFVFEATPTGELAELAQVAIDDAWNVAIDGGLAYVAAGVNGLVIVDLADPAAPVVRGSVDLEGIAKDVIVSGARAYLALGGDGLAAVDVTSPDSPALLDWEKTPGGSIAIAHSPEHHALFLADWNDIRLFDVSNGDDPYLLGRQPLPVGDEEARTMGIAVDGDLVFGSNWDQVESYRFVPGVAAPDLVVSPLDLSLPDAAPGESSVGALVLSNAGPFAIEGIAATSGSALAVKNLPETIEPFGTAVAEVVFEPQSTQPLKGLVTLASNDVDQASQNVGISANLPGLGVDDALPSWSFFDLDGNQLAIADLLGNVTLLAYFATF